MCVICDHTFIIFIKHFGCFFPFSLFQQNQVSDREIKGTDWRKGIWCQKKVCFKIICKINFSMYWSKITTLEEWELHIIFFLVKLFKLWIFTINPPRPLRWIIKNPYDQKFDKKVELKLSDFNKMHFWKKLLGPFLGCRTQKLTL